MLRRGESLRAPPWEPPCCTEGWTLWGSRVRWKVTRAALAAEVSLRFCAEGHECRMRFMKGAFRSTKRKGLPEPYRRLGKTYPAVMQAYEALGVAVAEAGPLDARTRALVKLAIATGALREGAVHSHVRRALEAGCTPAEIRHAVLLSTTTVGFPGMMAALSWVEDILSRK